MTARALVLRALGLGDLLAAVPALRAVRRGLPGHELVLAAAPDVAELLLEPGIVDRALPASGLDPLDWTGPPPEVAVNLHGCGPQSHRVLLALRPRRLVAFACPDAGVGADAGLAAGGPAWRPGEHEVRRWCRLVEAAGWPADPAELVLPPAGVQSPAPGAVVVHPGAAHASRRWPAERFAAVAAALVADGHAVVVTGSAGERGLARRVARMAGLRSGAVLAGRTDMRGLSALVAGARLVVCGDTGVAHLATAHRTPSVVLFGPVPPWEWGPPADGPHTTVWRGAARTARGGRGDPLGDAVDPALEAVTVSEVLDAVRGRLRDSGGREPGGARNRSAQDSTTSARERVP